MSSANPVLSVDELRAHMRRRGFEATEVAVDLDTVGGVIVRARFEPIEPIPSPTVRSVAPMTAESIAKAQQAEYGKNTLKGGALVLGLLFAAFLFFFLTG